MARYIAIAYDIAKRGQSHLRQKGIVVSKIRGLDNISRADARAVEQALTTTMAWVKMAAR